MQDLASLMLRLEAGLSRPSQLIYRHRAIEFDEDEKQSEARDLTP